MVKMLARLFITSIKMAFSDLTTITDEESHFHELMNALEALEFSDKSIHEIFKCVAAVLYLGNVTFVSTDAEHMEVRLRTRAKSLTPAASG